MFQFFIEVQAGERFFSVIKRSVTLPVYPDLKLSIGILKMKNVLRTASIAIFSASVATAAQAADLLMDPPPMPQQAEAPNYGSGFLEGHVGKLDSRTKDQEETRWSLRGTHAVHVGSGFNVQADVEYKYNEDCCGENTTLAGTGHVFLRDSQHYAIGAYGHISNEEDATGKQEDVYHYGVEAALFMGSFSALGALGTGTVYTENNEYENTSGRIEGRFYATDNLRFDATLAMDQTTLINAMETSTHFGLRANWRMDEIPVTLFAGYRHEKEDLEVAGINLDPSKADVVYLGARFHWGSKSMKDEERNGALWDPNTRIGN